VAIKIFRSAAECRKWLEANHDCVTELWLGMHNQRTDKKSITYREALDEALCFGWIDGVRKSMGPTTYQQRFTPRKAKSYWSAVNIKRWNELVQLGRVMPAGVTAFERRSIDTAKYSFEARPKKLPAAYEKQFRANLAAWEFFRAEFLGAERQTGRDAPTAAGQADCRFRAKPPSGHAYAKGEEAGCLT